MNKKFYNIKKFESKINYFISELIEHFLMDKKDFKLRLISDS